MDDTQTQKSNLLAEAVADIGKALTLRRVWIALAIEDVNDAHRRTTLGPAWLLVNYVLMVGTFVLIFGHIMGVENYIAFVAIGMLVWNYISETISQGTSVFVREEAMIKGTVLPLTTYVFKLLAQSVIRFGYTLCGCLALVLITGVTPTPAWLYSLLGLGMLLLAAPPIIVIMGLLGAQYRDLQFVVSNLLRVGMFITPVMWRNNATPQLQALYQLNPLTYFIEIVREPIVVGAFPAAALGIAAIVTVALWLIAVPMLGYHRSRVVFYL